MPKAAEFGKLWVLLLDQQDDSQRAVCPLNDTFSCSDVFLLSSNLWLTWIIFLWSRNGSLCQHVPSPEPGSPTAGSSSGPHLFTPAAVAEAVNPGWSEVNPSRSIKAGTRLFKLLSDLRLLEMLTCTILSWKAAECWWVQEYFLMIYFAF